MEQYNLIVVKWGNLYTSEYVINLYNGAKRHTSVPFNFYVFTDDTAGLPLDKNWHFIKLPDYNVPNDRGWWYKMEIFNQQHNLQGKNLYIDLDVIIINDLKIFWDIILTNGIYICRDFNRQFMSNYQACNSSVMGWRNNTLDTLFKEFKYDIKKHVDRNRGDQDYIQTHAKLKFFWPDDLAMSWKWECWRGGKRNSGGYKFDTAKTIIDPNTRVLVFHGQPKPENCEDPKMVNLWQGYS